MYRVLQKCVNTLSCMLKRPRAAAWLNMCIMLVCKAFSSQNPPVYVKFFKKYPSSGQFPKCHTSIFNIFIKNDRSYIEFKPYKLSTLHYFQGKGDINH